MGIFIGHPFLFLTIWGILSKKKWVSQDEQKRNGCPKMPSQDAKMNTKMNKIQQNKPCVEVL